MSETDFQYGDYDIDALDELQTPVEIADALPYPEAKTQDVVEPNAVGFTSVTGVTTNEAIAKARLWSHERLNFGLGQCLATTRQYWNVPSKWGTAALSYEHAAHKHGAASGTDVPRGAPVWWTGGSDGAGHVAISIGGGLCLSTDWKEPGRIDVARIDDITSHWGLDFKGWTREINDVVVWKPRAPVATVSLANLKPGKRNADVLKLKKRLHAKDYHGFILLSSKFGNGTKHAYAQYQRNLGFTGNAADGVPGELSLKKLGFAVK